MIRISAFLIASLLATSLLAEPLATGATAPAIDVTIDDGSTLNLSDVYAKGPTLVYFYPKSFTGGCTKQACNLRDSFSGIQKAGLTILGVSADDAETQKRFRSEHELPFHLIADTQNKLSTAFSVPTNPKGFPKRQSFLIVDGKIAWLDLKAKPMTQAQDALNALERL